MGKNALANHKQYEGVYDYTPSKFKNERWTSPTHIIWYNLGENKWRIKKNDGKIGVNVAKIFGSSNTLGLNSLFDEDMRWYYRDIGGKPQTKIDVKVRCINYGEIFIIIKSFLL